MIKKFISQYSVRYPRSLTYMMQASEYYIDDYLSWFFRVKDFRNVERSGKLNPTTKAKLIYLAIWFEIFALITVAIYLLYYVPNLRLLGIVLLILTPTLVAFGIIPIVLGLRYLIEKPLEAFIANRLKTKLQETKAIKIGIAGSYGKTTMREILKSVLSAGKKSCCTWEQY